MSEDLVKALEWIAYGSFYSVEDVQKVARQALAAHKAKPTMAREELVGELVAKLRDLENANEVFIDSVGVDPYQHIQDISDGIDEALTKAQAFMEGLDNATK